MLLGGPLVGGLGALDLAGQRRQLRGPVRRDRQLFQAAAHRARLHTRLDAREQILGLAGPVRGLRPQGAQALGVRLAGLPFTLEAADQVAVRGDGLVDQDLRALAAEGAQPRLELLGRVLRLLARGAGGVELREARGVQDHPGGREPGERGPQPRHVPGRGMRTNPLLGLGDGPRGRLPVPREPGGAALQPADLLGQRGDVPRPRHLLRRRRIGVLEGGQRPAQLDLRGVAVLLVEAVRLLVELREDRADVPAAARGEHQLGELAVALAEPRAALPQRLVAEPEALLPAAPGLCATRAPGRFHRGLVRGEETAGGPPDRELARRRRDRRGDRQPRG
ncbi:hypothetical protein GCM10009836_08890 [Pseudonocardia ailaonensis]|uniref:Uncharacterized protein n=1 Tax=Pseudonocardia ailaonensis TaxID=367279 RepID=A0ABN2MN35_9PSEU